MWDSLRRLLQRPASSLLTCMVIGIALALPAGLMVALQNVERLSAGWDGAARVSMYLHAAVDDSRARRLSEDLRQRPELVDVHFISKAEALAEFQAQSGFGAVVSHLRDNPLPPVIVVTPRVDLSPARVAGLRAELAALPEVQEAQLDLEWVQRLQAMMKIAQRLTLAFAGLLALGVLLVVGNTIKLAVENRRDEIVIIKLVGGTDAFVRRPFLYTGFWYGLGGGLLAWCLVGLAMGLLRGPVSGLASLYQSRFALSGLGAGDSLGLLLVASALGLAGAWLVVGRQLRAIEP